MPADESKTTRKPPKLADIAVRIAEHLTRMEKNDPNHGTTRGRYWYASAWPAGSRVGVRYISYQTEWKLTKSDAIEYLAWLDAGNEGMHSAALSFNTRISVKSPD